MTDSKRNITSSWLTTGQISKRLNNRPETVANWIKKGLLPAGITPGGHYRIHPEDLVDFCEKNDYKVFDEWKKAITPLTIMAIDDDPDIIRAIVPFLEREDRRVFGCSDVAEAGMMLVKECPDLVILDLQLPGTDGIKIASLLREHAALRDTRIIVLSGFIDQNIKTTMQDLRIDYFLDKPPDFEKLNECIDESLNNARPKLAKSFD